jgi:hypothetical protein
MAAAALASCSFAPPQTIRVRGAEADLRSTEFGLPYALDKFSGSMPENIGVGLYDPGDGIQHLLIRMGLEQTESGMPEITGLGDNSFGEPLSFNIQIPGLLPINNRPLASIKNGVPCTLFFNGGVPSDACVDTGHLTITSSISGFNLSAEGVSVYVEHYDEESSQKQNLELLDHNTGTGEWMFNLGGIIFYKDSELFIGGLPDSLTGSVTLRPSIAAFSSITVTSAMSVSTPITLMQFGVKGDLTPEELADYIYNIMFYIIDIKFDLNRKVAGLKIEFFYKNDPQTGFALTDGPRFAQGTSSLADDFLIVTAKDVSLNIVDQPTGTQILYELKATAKPSGGEITLEDVSPEEEVIVTATPRFPPVFRIQKAVVNPDEMPDGLDLNIYIPDTAAGEEPINLAELLKTVEDFLPMENLGLSPGAFLYLNDELPRDMKLKIEASKGGAPVNLLPEPDDEGFLPIENDRGQFPVFTGNTYAGPLPVPALNLDGDKLMALLRSKPESLRLAIEAKMADPTTIEFSAEGKANTIFIKPGILLDLPLDMKILSDPPSADYAAIRLTQADEAERTDLFGRTSAADPLINIGGMRPEEISLALDYVNTLGAALDLALTSTDFSGNENFRKITPLRSGGQDTLTFNIKSSDVPFPFQPGFEALIPADQTDNLGRRYGVLKIVPGGIIRISELRADVQFGLDLAGGM